MVSTGAGVPVAVVVLTSVVFSDSLLWLKYLLLLP